MQLFRRLLLSYFPDSLAKDSFNPASMFISFISAKDFFTIIDRKIIENYKLNLFDLSMDVFEGKLGLGTHKEMMQSKMTDAYYSYIASANFNGYKFYNIGNTATAMTLVCSLYLYEAFDKSEDSLFVDALYSFYLLTFLFAAKIKDFPGIDEKSDFQWFIDLYFNFFEVISGQLHHKVPKSNILKLKTKMLEYIDIFFMMFYYEKRVSNIYIDTSKPNKNYETEFYQWLFGAQPTAIQKTFLQNKDKILNTSNFSEVEEALIFEFAPVDMHLKYLFLETDIADIISCIIANIYDRKLLDKKLTTITKSKENLDFILDYVTNPDNFKKGFFKGVKQYVAHMRLENQDSYEELDEMISEIGDDMDKLDQMQIPASIKRESKIMEQFLNFYVSYIGGLFFSRSDSFFFRFFKGKLIPELIQYFDVHLKSEEAIQISGMNHVLYSKNQAYYQFVNKKVRAGKEKFFVPATTIKGDTIKATAFLLKSQDEIALTTLLQDCNPRIGKLYVKNKELLNRFQAQYSQIISPMIKLSQRDFVYNYYEPIFGNFKLGKNVLNILQNALTEQDVVRLKNSLYAFDVQLFREVISMFPWKKFQKIYNDTVILQNLSLLRETLFGFIIYYKYLQDLQQQSEGKLKPNLSLLKKIYFSHILNRDESLFAVGSKLIDTLIEQFGTAFSIFVEFDDNKEFFSILKDNWLEFLTKQGKKSELEKENSFSIEDLLWLRGVFKHITYYNKRYLIPNNG